MLQTGSTGFYRVSVGLTGFRLISLGFTEFYWVLLSINMLFTGFLPGFTGFCYVIYWVLLGLYELLMGSTSFLLVLLG